MEKNRDSWLGVWYSCKYLISTGVATLPWLGLTYTLCEGLASPNDNQFGKLLWCDISVKKRYPGCKRSKLHASVRNFMQALVTSCKRFKNFMQAVQNFMQAVPKLYASGPKLYASGPKLYASLRNFMQAFVTSCKRS